MRRRTLEEWLQWQMDLHDKAIDLGLERVSVVAGRLGIGRISSQVITVAGTNGKGSSVAAYENWLRHAGFSVASYTSPHLLRYNERIRQDLTPVRDDQLCAAFAAVEEAREDTALTYFEFGTLAALHLMQAWQPDFAVLEVGLGGRLDAVNIIDADLVHLTPIGIDHENWLGENREQIGMEKAGVLRPAIPVVVNDPQPPQSVLDEIERLQCVSLRIGRDYRIREAGERLLWQAGDLELELEPVLPGVHQAANLAGVVAGLSCLLPLSDYDARAVRENFRGTRLAGRFQRLADVLPATVYIDVGHNQDAARSLASCLTRIAPVQGRTVVLLGMLEDKRADLFVEALDAVVDVWWLLSLDTDRGLSAAQLRERVEPQIRVEHCFDDMGAALDHALLSLGNRDIMLVTGSFVTVEKLLRALPESDEPNNYGSKH